MSNKATKEKLFEMMGRLDENFDTSVKDANRDDVLSFKELSILQNLTDNIKSRFENISEENIENLKRVLSETFDSIMRREKIEPNSPDDNFFNYKGDSTTHKI